MSNHVQHPSSPLQGAHSGSCGCSGCTPRGVSTEVRVGGPVHSIENRGISCASVGRSPDRRILTREEVVEEAARKGGVAAIKQCSTLPIPAGQIIEKVDGTLGWGMRLCDDQFCLRCAPRRARIDALRAELILRRARELGWSAYFVTLTFDNSGGGGGLLGPREQLEVLANAYQSPATFGRVKPLQALGWVSTITRFETTLRPLGDGCVKHHNHLHLLAFFDHPEDVTGEVVAGAIKRRWLSRVKHVGESAYISLQRVECLDLDDAPEAVSKYMGGDTLEKMGAVARPIAHEVSSFGEKTTRGEGGMGFAAFAHWVCNDAPLALQAAYWREYHRAITAGRGEDRTRGMSMFRIGRPLTDLFKTEEEAGGERLRRLAEDRQQLEGGEDREVVRSAAPPRRWGFQLARELKAKGLYLRHFTRALSGDDALSRTVRDQLFAHLDDVLCSPPEEQDRLMAEYLPSLAHYVSWVTAERRTRGAPPPDE